MRPAPSPARAFFFTAGLLLLAGPATSATDQPPIGSDPLQQFLAWFPGEYDNHEQVWQEGLDKAAEPHERLHHLFVPVAVPALGEHVYYVQQHLDGDPGKIYRQRLYAVRGADDAVRMTIWSFRDEAPYRDAHLKPELLRNLGPGQLATTPGCEVTWTPDPDGSLHGRLQDGACRFVSPRTGRPLRVTDDLRLAADEIWIRDEAFDESGARIFGRADGVHHKNRKVRYYTGWAGVKVRGPAATKADEEWHSAREVILHNEGQVWRILDAAGKPSGWSVELARLTYQETRTAVLKVGLIDEATGETVAYAWANPEAERIGINLRWAQIGLRLKRDAPAFGFIPAYPSAAR